MWTRLSNTMRYRSKGGHNMKILVKSARDASRDTYRNTLDNKKIIIISITTPGDKINSFASRSNILDILRLSFNDIGCRDA